MADCEYCTNEATHMDLCEDCFHNCDHEWDIG